MGDADFASPDREHLGGFFFLSHQNRLHRSGELRCASYLQLKEDRGTLILHKFLAVFVETAFSNRHTHAG